MTQAEQPPTTNPSDVYLTRKGERVVADHLQNLKLPESPEGYFRTLASMRKEARDEIERLIDFLDRAAGDPDLEPSLGENPYIGDRATVDLEGDTSDDEFSLGWTGTINQASRHRLGDATDAEKDDADKEESDEGEANGDEEPSLGWTNPQPGRQLSQGDSIWSRQQRPFFDVGVDQTGLGGFASIEDLEDEHDGREPDSDDEDGGDREPNGDERDHSSCEDEHFGTGLFGRVMDDFRGRPW